LALYSEHPVRLGDRCTVFMESSVVAEQQKNTCIEDILAGLAYSTVFNYLHKVVGRKKDREKMSFQGGTALNRAVVAAFESVLAAAIIVPDHMDILGAVGIAHYAKESYKKGDYKFSRFRGIDVLLETDCMIFDPYGCKDCENRCHIQQIELIGKKNSREIVTWGGNFESRQYH
jgi:hypothetical protein